MRRRRHRKRPAELISLIDVLFILLFAALIQAHEARNKVDAPDAGTPDAGVAAADAAVPDAGPPDAMSEALLDAAPSAADAGVPSAHLAQARQLAATLARAARGRDVIAVEISRAGDIAFVSSWAEGEERRRERVDHRLVRPVLPGESDEELEYLGARGPAARLCRVLAALRGGAGDSLGNVLVLVTTEVPLGELPLALYRGLRADTLSCFTDAGGIAILLDPATMPDTPTMEESDGTQ